MVRDVKLVSKLFFAFLRLGLFTFGGGFAMLPLIERELVYRYKWLTEDEFFDSLSIVQALPGVVAVNMALAVGYQAAGRLGSFVAAVGVIIPSFVVIIGVAGVYTLLQASPLVTSFFAGVRPVVVGLLVAAALKMGGRILKSWRRWLICLSVFVLVSFAGVNPVYPIIAAAAVGVLGKGRPKSAGEDDLDSLGEER